jgi:hypothetical protein
MRVLGSWRCRPGYNAALIPFSRRQILAGLLLEAAGVCACGPVPPGRTAPPKAPGVVERQEPDLEPAEPPSEVLVLGMIHGAHRGHPHYGIEVIQAIVRAVRPRYVLTEIPPDRVAAALAEFEATGTVAEPRVKRFPEYIDALFPLTEELDFEIVACAGWTRGMADDRKAKLARWKTERPEDTAEVERAQQRAERLQAEEGLDADPWGIHSARYDELVAEGMEPYNRLFNTDLGAGGWDNINEAHYALIAKALDTHRGEGARVLITFGAWHKYWFNRRLRLRDDIVLRALSDFYPQR